MATAYVGLGSNLDAPAQQVERAFQALRGLPQTGLVARSRLYRTAPWGGVAQPDFVNAVARMDTQLEPQALMAALLSIERDFGRVRDGERYGPRVLDLDVLLYGALSIDEPGLRIPHPLLHERAFVLVPLAELEPNLTVPGRGAVRLLLEGLSPAACVPLEG